MIEKIEITVESLEEVQGRLYALAGAHINTNKQMYAALVHIARLTELEMNRIYEQRRKKYMITDADIENWFTYHPPTHDQLPKYEQLREAGMTFAKIILKLTPPSPDQTTAIRKIREAIMTANAAIACDNMTIKRKEENG